MSYSFNFRINDEVRLRDVMDFKCKEMFYYSKRDGLGN